MSNNGLSMEDISRGVRSFTIGTAVSRVMGLAREMVVAHLFGAGFAVDAYNVAFRIPNLLRDLFAETALSAAFVPVLTAEKAKAKEAENRLASNIFNVLFVVTGAISLAGFFAAPYLAKAIAFGFNKVPGKIGLTTQLTAVLFPFLLFISLAAWAMSYLNTEKSFFVPSVAPAVFNLFSILFPLLSYGWYVAHGKEPIFGLAVGILVGGLMQFLVQVPSLRRKGFRWMPVLSFRDPQFRRVMALFLPVAVGLAGTRINVLVNTILVTPLAQGSVSWLSFAFRIMHLPLGPLRHRRRDRGPALALEARPRGECRSRQVHALGLAEDGPVPDRADIGSAVRPGHSPDPGHLRAGAIHGRGHAGHGRGARALRPRHPVRLGSP